MNSSGGGFIEALQQWAYIVISIVDQFIPLILQSVSVIIDIAVVNARTVVRGYSISNTPTIVIYCVH